MRFGIIVFPGSNCDADCRYAIEQVVGETAFFIWHKEETLPDLDVVILPGGFSYGDYLRTGAIARISPIMSAVTRFANSGGFVLGICNGFQILTEAGLLPGVLLRNKSLKFICKSIHVTVQNNNGFTSQYEKDEIVGMPIAHAEGNYYIDASGLADLTENNQILFRYCDETGRVSEEANPNGAIGNIAGICNKAGNVLGMMPHPERSVGSLAALSGIKLFQSLQKIRGTSKILS